MIRSIVMGSLLALVVILFSFSCSNTPVGNSVQFEVETFKQVTGRTEVRTPLYFVDVDTEGTIGYCVRFGEFKQLRYIGLEIADWDNLKMFQKLILVLHELVHCDCDVGHIEGFFYDGCPSSIMHPSMMSEFCAQTHIRTYLNQVREYCDETSNRLN